MNHPVEDEPFKRPLRGCGCVLIAAVTLVVAGGLLLGSILGDCFDNPRCLAHKESVWVWLTPLLVLGGGLLLGGLFLQMTRRRN